MTTTKAKNRDLDRLEASLSSFHHRWDILDKVPQNTLKATLKELLPHINSDSWQERIDWGGIYLNGKSVFADSSVEAPVRIEYFEPRYEFANREQAFPRLTEEHVVYSDNDCVVVYKPQGLPTLPTREQRNIHLKGELEKLIGGDLHLPSRLDTGTSGLVLLSKSERMHKELQQAFEAKRIAKAYIFKSHNSGSWEQLLLTAPIAKDRSHPILRKVSLSGGGKVAITSFKKAASNLFFAYPKTGRTHQIRVHASFLGLPIIGDNFYGGASHNSLHLLSYSLEFYQPFLDEKLRIVCPDSLLPDWAR